MRGRKHALGPGRPYSDPKGQPEQPRLCQGLMRQWACIIQPLMPQQLLQLPVIQQHLAL